jgi:hypothetical protein
MKLKSIISLILVFILLLSSFSISAYAYTDDAYMKNQKYIKIDYSCNLEKLSDKERTELNKCLNNTIAVTYNFYYSQQKFVRENFSKYIYYDSLQTYLQMELSRSLAFTESDIGTALSNNLVAKEFDAAFILFDYILSDDYIIVMVRNKFEIMYPSTDETTIFGNDTYALLNRTDKSYKVIDIIISDCITNKEEKLSLKTWSPNNTKEIAEKYERSLENLKLTKNGIKSFERFLLNQGSFEGAPSVLKKKLSEKSTTTTYNFNRSVMSNYAKATAPLQKNPSDNKLYKSNGTSARGSSQAPYYYDFSSVQYSYDCTNFASHVLLSGGAKMKDNSNATTGWYFHNTNNPGSNSRSYSWTGATSFGDFLISNTGNGPKGSLVSYFSSNDLGDVIQFKYSDYNPSGFGHTTIITNGPYLDNLSNYSQSIGPIFNAGITSRSSNGADGFKINQNLYRKLFNMDGGNTVVGYRSIHLTGYSY